MPGRGDSQHSQHAYDGTALVSLGLSLHILHVLSSSQLYQGEAVEFNLKCFLVKL